MKRKTFIFILVIAIMGLGSCNKNRGVVDIHNAQISLDWNGVYTGTIPSASGSGINVRLKLTIEQTFELSYEYLDKADGSFNWTGSFTWDDTGSIITLDTNEAPPHYKVAENKLIQLDMDGKPISGSFADKYVLKKEM